MTQLPKPFSGRPPADIPLSRSPLVRVLAQVRFSDILGLSEASYAAPFQEAVRSHYPLTVKDLIHRVEIASASPEPAAVKAESVWRFQSRDGHWRVSLATNFIALEATRYTSRRDFLDRMAFLLEALAKTLNPTLVLRVGMRYINRIQGDDVEKIPRLIEPDILGCQQSEFGKAAQHLITDAMLATAEQAMLHARWGLLPPGATIDPLALDALDSPAWILDLDMYNSAQTDFVPAALIPQLESYAERIYAVFRAMIRDEFLTHFGGDDAR